jgi:hypothetical protein
MQVDGNIGGTQPSLQFKLKMKEKKAGFSNEKDSADAKLCRSVLKRLPCGCFEQTDH